MKNEFENLKSVCFSGHRIVPFAKQNEIMRLLRNEITKSYNEGYSCFYCGMAIGFDLLAAKATLSLKSELPQIKIIAVLPFREQNEKWNEKNKVEYEAILKKVDELLLVTIITNDAFCNAMIIWYNGVQDLSPCMMVNSKVEHFIPIIKH